MGASDERIPRIVWMLWFQGWDRAPYVCRNCRKSFELWNPTWEVRALDEQTLPDVLGDYCKQFTEICKANNPLAQLGMSWIPPAAAADVLRLFLLERFGGVWADATVLCRRPLDEWIDAKAAAREGFFAYAPEKGDEIPIMSSFLASRPGHPLVQAWQQRVHAHWQLPPERRPSLEYFWLHLLFGRLVKEDSLARKLWFAAKAPGAEYGQPGPHRHMPYEEVLTKAPGAEFKALLEEDEEPIYKLTIHDVKYDKSGLDRLLQRDGTEFPKAKASESSFEFLMQHTLKQAEARSSSSPERCRDWRPERSSYREHYGLSLANQPMMPG